MVEARQCEWRFGWVSGKQAWAGRLKIFLSASTQSMKPKIFLSFIHSFQNFGFSAPRSIFRRPGPRQVEFCKSYIRDCPVRASAKKKLDESTARRQLKSPRSLSGRSIHLTLVTKWSRSWSWMTYCLTLYAMSISPPILRYIHFKIWPWKSMVKVMCVVKGQGHVWPSNFKGQDYGQGQTHWSHLRPGVQWICLLFVPWQSDHFWLRYSKFHIWPWKSKVKVMAKAKPDGHIWGLGVQSICLLFVPWQSDHFWLRYNKFHIWPWKFKVKVMAKVTSDGHIWALEFYRYVCFSFRGNRTIFGWDIANSIFDLEKSRKIDQNLIR